MGIFSFLLFFPKLHWYSQRSYNLKNHLTRTNSQTLRGFELHEFNCIRSLAIKIYKAIHNLPGEFLRPILFIRNNHNYNLRSESELSLPNVNTVLKRTKYISFFGSVIWNSIPFELRKASSYQFFRSEIKPWRPTNYLCRLFKNYIGYLGFINTSS